jgi:hypothetical protein
MLGEQADLLRRKMTVFSNNLPTYTGQVRPLPKIRAALKEMKGLGDAGTLTSSSTRRRVFWPCLGAPFFVDPRSLKDCRTAGVWEALASSGNEASEGSNGDVPAEFGVDCCKTN